MAKRKIHALVLRRVELAKPFGLMGVAYSEGRVRFYSKRSR